MKNVEMSAMTLLCRVPPRRTDLQGAMHGPVARPCLAFRVEEAGKPACAVSDANNLSILSSRAVERGRE